MMPRTDLAGGPLLGVEAHRRLVDLLVDLDYTDSPRDPHDVSVDVGRDVVGVGEGALGDPARPPRVDLASLQCSPADPAPRGVGQQPDSLGPADVEGAGVAELGPLDVVEAFRPDQSQRGGPEPLLELPS